MERQRETHISMLISASGELRRYGQNWQADNAAAKAQYLRDHPEASVDEVEHRFSGAWIRDN